jgi:hypothetical protein
LVATASSVAGDLDYNYFNIYAAGTLLEPKNDKPLWSQSVFYGKCLKGSSDKALLIYL